VIAQLREDVDAPPDVHVLGKCFAVEKVHDDKARLVTTKHFFPAVNKAGQVFRVNDCVQVG
jgi:hypothetical protein